MHMVAVLTAVALVACSAFFLGCDSSKPSGQSEGTPLEAYAAPYPVFDDAAAEGDGSCAIDTSQVSSGVVGAWATSGSRIKFQVVHDGETYNYDLPANGTPTFFPLQSDDGYYNFNIMENITGDKYSEVYSTGARVSLDSEFEPFLRPNQIVSYTASSACVKRANDMRAKCSTNLELAADIYSFIASTIKYDSAKAASVASGYLPDPDTTLSTRKGICFDYASLAAAMLRSQGIPTKVVTGYVLPENIYHAWNVIYFEETGWLTVKIEVEGSAWKQVDLTFAASDGSKDISRTYTDRYVY